MIVQKDIGNVTRVSLLIFPTRKIKEAAESFLQKEKKKEKEIDEKLNKIIMVFTTSVES